MEFGVLILGYWLDCCFLGDLTKKKSHENNALNRFNPGLVFDVCTGQGK
jgi:hypothetical protein